MKAKQKPINRNYHIEHDALTEDGMPVLFLVLPNTPRLIQFKRGLDRFGGKGMVIGFDFQKEILGRYLGERVEFMPLDFKKVKGVFLENVKTVH